MELSITDFGDIIWLWSSLVKSNALPLPPLCFKYFGNTHISEKKIMKEKQEYMHDLFACYIVMA